MDKKAKSFVLLILVLLSGLYGFAKNDSTDATKDSVNYHFTDNPHIAALDSLLNWDYPLFFSKDSTAEALVLNDSVSPQFPDSIYQLRLDHLNAQTPFDLRYNEYVKRFINVYANKKREQVSRMLGLAELYFPLFEELLDRYELPLELKYLAVIESALNPTAVSRAGAKGLWQFMYPTGKYYGLKVSSYVDERYDPYKATEAACKYLSHLYRIFGDWNLALAAYNSGSGNVTKAIRRSGGHRDYWRIRPYLPRETAGYVPAFIAANYVMNYAAEHKLKAMPPRIHHYGRDTVVVKQLMPFEQLSKMLDISIEELTFLNPSYKLKLIPHIKGRNYTLCLPKDKLGVFVANEDSIYKSIEKELAKNSKPLPRYVEMSDRIVHRVRSGEYLGYIAKKYGVSVRKIKRWNRLRGSMLRVGQRLTIYPRNVERAIKAEVAKKDKSKNKKAKKQKTATKEETKETTKSEVKTDGQKEVLYTVRNGDTLWSIARKYPGISAKNIKSWNGIRNEKNIKPGMQLKIITEG